MKADQRTLGVIVFLGVFLALCPKGIAQSCPLPVLHRFAAKVNDGRLPYTGVVLDSSGNVYGTTLQGGKSGTVFRLALQPDGHWKETILWDFPNSGKDGGGPIGGLVFDNVGNLYGTASGGGDPNCPVRRGVQAGAPSQQQVEIHGAASL